MALVLMVCILILTLGLMVYNTCMSVYTWFNHCGWEENSNPDKNAKIQNISSERVKYSKNGAKLKTTITFSDGFYFITYKTDRDDGILTYKIYLSKELKEEIVGSAIEQHNFAVDKFMGASTNEKNQK